MKYSSFLVLFALLLCFTGFHSSAQSGMYIRLKTHTQSEHLVSDVYNITFASGNVLVKGKGTTSSTNTITAVRYINFVNLYPTSIQNEFTAVSLSIYPNPSTESIHITSSNNVDLANARCSIIDMFGKVVKQVKWDGISALNIMDIQNGIYIFSIQTPAGEYSTKFMKQ